MKNKNKKIKSQINPEILREERERRAYAFYDDDDYSMTLFPGAFLGSTASSTESTGLIQVIPPTPEMLNVYDDVYSYRQSKPIVNKD